LFFGVAGFVTVGALCWTDGFLPNGCGSVMAAYFCGFWFYAHAGSDTASTRKPVSIA
jgi:hypothetical protein